MNNISIAKIHTVISLACFAMVIALFGSVQTASAQVPEISTYPASEITSTTAVFSGVVFDTGNKSTTAWFEYGTSPSSLNRTVGLSGVYQKPENRTVKVRNLDPDTTYYYRLVAENSEGVTRGQRYELETLVNDVSSTVSSQPSNNTDAGNNPINNSNNQSGTNNTSSGTNGSTANSGGSNASSNTNTQNNNTESKTIDFSDQDIIGESKYSRLSIENGVETVFPGETFTYRVVYHNKTNTDVKSAKLVIVIPEGFEILSFSKGLHEPGSSTIVVQLGTIEAKSTDELTVLVRANSALENYVVATAELTVAVGSDQFLDTVRARDVDAYGSGASLGLGANASGTGIFGNIILILFLVIVVGAIIVISSRIIMKKRNLEKKTEYNVEDIN